MAIVLIIDRMNENKMCLINKINCINRRDGILCSAHNIDVESEHDIFLFLTLNHCLEIIQVEISKEPRPSTEIQSNYANYGSSFSKKPHHVV